MAPNGAVTAPGDAPAELRSARSWIDHLTDAIDRLPIPAWVCYGLFLLAVVVWINAVNWIAGRYPPGTFDLRASGYAVYGVYMLALVHYLNRVADSKIEAFRPALDDDVEYRRLREELTTLPAREATLAGLGGVTFVAALYASEAADADIGALLPLVLIGGLLVEAGTFAFLAVLIYHTVRQLRLVSRIHARASRIDLFEPRPLHAFSELTARTGIGLLVLMAYSYLIDPSVTVVGVGLTVLIIVVAASAFVLPLVGMHRRMVVEKERLQLEADRRLKESFARLHLSVDERDLSVADAMYKSLASLQLEREALARLSTWPWQPTTLRGFVSALVIPIVLWYILRVLERYL
jgi:hypothetical protein